MNVLLEKFRDVVSAVLPITLIVVILNFTITPLESHLLLRFILGVFVIILGLSVFLFGADIGVTPIGTLFGSHMAKSNKVWVVALGGLSLGFMISIAEPDLHILAGQVEAVSGGSVSKVLMVVVVSIGLAALMTTGLFRIVFNRALNKLLAAAYVIIGAMAVFSSPEFVAIAFDASGATTGAITVPFMLAIAYGVSSLKKDGQASEEDSFGLVGVASAGAILGVIAMSLGAKRVQAVAEVESAFLASTSVLAPFVQQLPHVVRDSILALLPLLVAFVIFEPVSFKLPRRQVSRIVKGMVYTFIGLVLFLLGVNAGFMDVGSIVGGQVVTVAGKWVLVGIGFALGTVVVLAEPAVYVLTKQIEEVTAGYVKRRLVLLALSLGIGIAVALAMLRITTPTLQLWHYLLPGYIISLILAFQVPPLFVGIAFDAGGVASGPMTASFILAFAQGAAQATAGADPMAEGFGVIAMVAMMPLIALQLLGLAFKLKTAKGGTAADGE
ncbi:MAG: DUF1538 domain-containing protein [Bacillota bacterium]